MTDSNKIKIFASPKKISEGIDFMPEMYLPDDYLIVQFGSYGFLLRKNGETIDLGDIKKYVEIVKSGK